jgi:3-dehydroquinate synthase
MLEKVKIDLEKNFYDILIGNNLLENCGDYIAKAIPQKNKVFIITDENVAKLYLQKTELSLKKHGFETFSIIIPAGEKSKNIDQFAKILDEVLSKQIERKSTLIALGGGVVGDITGYAAASLLRGVNFIQIPTSLLAMVDSSVGGKTGINSKYGKNLIGAFYQPKLVLADLDILKTLPKREFLAGYAEIVKYGLINDIKFFEFLETQNDFSKIAEMVKTSCEAKAQIVAADEKENDIRALLNLGHTFGHAFETLHEYDGSLLHGEAVAIGMILAFQFSEFLEICKTGCANRVENLLRKHGIKTKVSELGKKYSVDEIIKLMYQDKKVSGGNLVLILAKNIGESFIKKDVSEKDLREFLKTKI